MSKKLFSVVGFAVFVAAVVFNFNAGIGSSNNVEMNIALSNIEALVMGECTATATGCDVSCTGQEWCTFGSSHVACDGNFKYCS